MDHEDTFKVVWYMTKHDTPMDSDYRFFFFGSRQGCWNLWHQLKKEWPHVKVFDLDGEIQKPELGLAGLSGRAL